MRSARAWRRRRTVDGSVASRLDQPGGGVGGDWFALPVIERADGRVLETLFSQVETAQHPNEGRQDAAVLVPKRPLEGHWPRSGRQRRSANGPSVVRVWPSRRRTVVAVATGIRASPACMMPAFWTSSV